MVDALMDTGCGWTLVHKAVGEPLAEFLQIRCIHGDVKDYLTVRVHLQVAGKHFHCAVGVVPHLDNPVLLGFWVYTHTLWVCAQS